MLFRNSAVSLKWLGFLVCVFVFSPQLSSHGKCLCTQILWWDYGLMCARQDRVHSADSWLPPRGSPEFEKHTCVFLDTPDPGRWWEQAAPWQGGSPTRSRSPLAFQSLSPLAASTRVRSKGRTKGSVDGTNAPATSRHSFFCSSGTLSPSQMPSKSLGVDFQSQPKHLDQNWELRKRPKRLSSFLVTAGNI